MLKLPKLPGLPNINGALSAIDKADSIIDGGLSLIDRISGKLDRLVPDETPKQSAFSHPRAALAGVSDTSTVLYQLDHIFQPLRQLELHLAEGCQIAGIPCDCCQKSAGDVRIFSLETIPIAARAGIDPSIFDGLTTWAAHIEDIGSEENSKSGRYRATYQQESGNASRYRKAIQKLISMSKQPAAAEECPTCEGIKSFVAKAKAKAKAQELPTLGEALKQKP